MVGDTKREWVRESSDGLLQSDWVAAFDAGAGYVCLLQDWNSPMLQLITASTQNLRHKLILQAPFLSRCSRSLCGNNFCSHYAWSIWKRFLLALQPPME